MFENWKWDDCSVKELLRKITSYDAPEYWQKEIDAFKASKQPKPEWEILEGIHPNAIEPHEWLTREKCFQQGGATCEQEGCKIHSVRRLSDGEVFTVGDTVDIWPKESRLGRPMQPMDIEKFVIHDDGMMAYYGSFGYYLNRLVRRVPTVDPVPVLLTPSEIEKLHNILNAY